METPSPTKPSFEEALPEINAIVQSRRSAWTYVSIMEWSDVSQIILLRVFEKWYQFDPSKGPLEHWVNRLVTNAILNVKRDQGGARWSRPCVGGGKSNGKSCVYNTGDDACSFTKSGKQCNECPLYREWAKTRQYQFHIKSTVALDHHAQEVSNKQEDFCDYDGIKDTVDKQMRANLTQWEYRIYQCLFIKHLSPTETGKVLETLIKTWKRAPRAEEETGYQFILGKQRWFKQLMVMILTREGHIDEDSPVVRGIVKGPNT